MAEHISQCLLKNDSEPNVYYLCKIIYATMHTKSLFGRHFWNNKHAIIASSRRHLPAELSLFNFFIRDLVNITDYNILIFII